MKRLGINRIFGHLDDVQKEIPLNILIEGAQTVYFLGTSLSITALRDRFIRENTETDFRFIFVTLGEEDRKELSNALAIIHNTAMDSKLQETEMAFSRISSKFSNVHHKSVVFVPPFSAILALGTSHDGKEWGRLQIDHYLLRTVPDSRLWLFLEDNQSALFVRYRQIVEDIWTNPDKYDVRCTDFA